MVEFNIPEEEEHPPQKKGGIEEHVGEEDVAEQALRIAVEQHERQHRAKNEEHHVKVRRQDKLISEDEERVIEEIKKQDKSKDHGYKLVTAESASGAYGRLSGEGSGAYGHGHTHSEASCSCGWRATPEHAMNEFMQTQQDKKKGSSQYAGGDHDGPSGVYGKHDTLEGLAHGYQSSMSGDNPPAYQ